MKSVILTTLLLITSISFSQSKVEEINIKTSSECNMCKDRIEEKLNYTKGVTFVSLDVSTKMLLVKYKPEKIKPEKIRAILSELGYDADDVNANSESQKKLPKCCQPNGMNKH